MQSLLGGLRHLIPPPPPLGIPHIVMVPQNVSENPAKKGGQGDAPLALPPPLGSLQFPKEFVA